MFGSATLCELRGEKLSDSDGPDACCSAMMEAFSGASS